MKEVQPLCLLYCIGMGRAARLDLVSTTQLAELFRKYVVCVCNIAQHQKIENQAGLQGQFGTKNPLLKYEKTKLSKKYPSILSFYFLA